MPDQHAMLSSLVDPKRSALLVVDVQRYFTRERPKPLYPPVDEVLGRLRHFIDACRSRGLLVVRIQAVVPDDAVTAGVWRRHWGERWASPSPLAPGQPGVEFHPGFEPQPGDLVVTKPRYSSFHGSSLESLLRSRGIQTVLVGGLTTDVCVSSTSRDAFELEFDVVTLSDCTATGTQARHEVGLVTLAETFGMVCSSTAVLATWDAQLVPAVAS